MWIWMLAAAVICLFIRFIYRIISSRVSQTRLRYFCCFCHCLQPYIFYQRNVHAFIEHLLELYRRYFTCSYNVSFEHMVRHVCRLYGARRRWARKVHIWNKLTFGMRTKSSRISMYHIHRIAAEGLKLIVWTESFFGYHPLHTTKHHRHFGSRLDDLFLTIWAAGKC